jgi:hypothetical protein
MATPDVLLRLHPNGGTLADVRIDWDQLLEGSATITLAEATEIRTRLDLAIEAAHHLAASRHGQASPGSDTAPEPGDPASYPDAVPVEGDGEQITGER